MLLDVLDRVVRELRRDERVRAERRVQAEHQVALDVRDVVLLQVGVRRLADRHGRVLVRQGALLRCRHVAQELADVGDLELLEEPLLHRLRVVQVRVLVRPQQHRLHLRHALRLAEDVRVADGNDVGVAVEVVALDVHVLDDVALAHLVEVPPVQPAQDLDQPLLRLVQAGVDGRVDRRALLDQRLGGAHRRVGRDVSDLLFAGGHHPLGGGTEPAQELEEHR